MNTIEFQELCRELNEKYNANEVTDADVDIFADIISNVLGRDDLKAEGTSYRELAENISYKYEKDIQMNPLLARLYEICRMYDNFRARPLTETEARSIVSDKKTDTGKHSIIVVAHDGYRQLASCWWENVVPSSGTAKKISEIIDGMPKLEKQSDPVQNAANIELLEQIASCFTHGDAGFDPLDMEAVELFGDGRPLALNRESGIIEVMDGMERNRKRGGAIIKLDLRNRTVRMDDYLLYGLDFYRQLIGDETFETTCLPVLDGSKINYTFEEAHDAAEYWEQLPSPFLLPGNSKMVAVQGPVLKSKSC